MIMLSKVQRWRHDRLVASNENAPEGTGCGYEAATTPSDRALATGAALAVSLDASPAVLVSLYDHARRQGPRGRRCA
jgi:hypothetical protein